MYTVELNKTKRFEEINVQKETRKIHIEATRDKCNDILIELVDAAGNAKSKPLHKFMPLIKINNQIVKIRFIMNDFSSIPITINLKFV